MLVVDRSHTAAAVGTRLGADSVVRAEIEQHLVGMNSLQAQRSCPRA